MTYIDDDVSRNVREYYRKLEQRVVYNVERGNWDRAERWARLLWEFTAAAQSVLWEERADAS
jgi:hypothetical protein